MTPRHHSISDLQVAGVGDGLLILRVAANNSIRSSG
jgi:hypothetical protein